MNQYERMWRVQVRITSVDRRRGIFRAVVPARYRARFTFSLSVLPRGIRKDAEKDFRCHAMSNFGAKEPADMVFSGWER